MSRQAASIDSRPRLGSRATRATALPVLNHGLGTGDGCVAYGALRAWVEAVFQQFDGQMLPFAAETARRCAMMHVPDANSMRDSMIAVTALQHGLALVTRNGADFDGINVKLINPWEAQA